MVIINGMTVQAVTLILGLLVDYFICHGMPVNPALCAPQSGCGVDHHNQADKKHPSRLRITPVPGGTTFYKGLTGAMRRSGFLSKSEAVINR